MMNLTKADREAFVRAVMDDVPSTDYTAEQQKLFLDYCVSRLPPPVRAIYEDPELRGCLGTIAQYIDGAGYFSAPGGNITPTPELVGELQKLRNSAFEQSEARRELAASVTAMIAGCRTLKQAKERLPEFAKYLPADRDSTGTANLPAVANTVGELTKAGWPKDKEKAA